MARWALSQPNRQAPPRVNIIAWCFLLRRLVGRFLRRRPAAVVTGFRAGLGGCSNDDRKGRDGQAADVDQEHPHTWRNAL